MSRANAVGRAVSGLGGLERDLLTHATLLALFEGERTRRNNARQRRLTQSGPSELMCVDDAGLQIPRRSLIPRAMGQP